MARGGNARWSRFFCHHWAIAAHAGICFWRACEGQCGRSVPGCFRVGSGDGDLGASAEWVVACGDIAGNGADSMDDVAEGFRGLVFAGFSG